MSKQGNERISTKNFQESLSSKHLSECSSCKTINVTSYGKGCSSKITEPTNQCSNNCNVNIPTKSSAAHNFVHQRQIWRAKVNSHFNLQKNQRNVKEAQVYWAKRSGCNNVKEGVSLQGEKFFVKHTSFSGRGLLPTPMAFSSGHSKAPHLSKKVANIEPQVHRGFYSKVFVQSSNWFPQHQLSGNYSQYSFRCENSFCRRKGPGSNGGNFFRSCNNLVFPQRIPFHASHQSHHYNTGYVARRALYSSQPVVTHGSYCLDSCPAVSAHLQQTITRLGITGQSGFQLWKEMKIPWMNHVVGRSFHTFVKKKPYPGLKPYNDYRIGCDITRGTKVVWVPISRKGCGMLEKTCSAGFYDIPQFLSNELTRIHPQGNVVPFHGPTTKSDSKSFSMLSSHKIPSVGSEASKSGSSFVDGYKVESSREDKACGEKPRDTPKFIGSQVAIEAVNAAYKLQLVSQSIQLTMGQPLAEVERFLHSAGPVITSHYVYETCSVRFDNQKSNTSLSKCQIPNIPLCAVWNWYEKPGNYGLELKAEDSQKIKGLPTESIAFRAYFLPFLSAVQLFGYLHHSDSCSKDQGNTNSESEIKNKKEVESHFLSSRTMSFNHSLDAVSVQHSQVEDTKLAANFHSADGPVFLFKISQCKGGDGFSFISSPACSSDSELVFEFFESEQPQQRKPLHLKIMELISAGTSNAQAYGDPSKLESFNLHDLHPASWFSVAWYPIYRIPEGNFSASFLTYHSLGHFVGKCIPIDSLNKMFHIVFPVIGLQSYNTQGECWFDLRMPLESSSKEPIACRNAEMLRERIGTLEENALLFSRGCVSKNKVKVVNQHPDFEFFMSRKR